MTQFVGKHMYLENSIDKISPRSSFEMTVSGFFAVVRKFLCKIVNSVDVLNE